MLFQILALLTLCISQNIQAYEPTQAICIVPVADLLTVSMATQRPNADIVQAYKNIPLSWGTRDEYKPVCPRDHQLLFNEIVTIIDEVGDEACINITQSFYETPLEFYKHYTYWTLTSNLIKMSDLAARNVPLDMFPEPISFQANGKHKTSANHENIVALKVPYQAPETGVTYSAGTRFVLAHDDPSDCLSVWAVDATTFQPTTLCIPSHYCVRYDAQARKNRTETRPCIVCSGPLTNAEKIDDFVRILQLWAHVDRWTQQSDDYIPCVWGGCSFVQTHKLALATEMFTVVGNQKLGYWNTPEQITNPCTGFDVSGMVLRAAQLCDLPYFCKNTLTAVRNLTPLAPDEQLSEGDLLWFPHALMVVTSLEHNQVVTLMGYYSGYGKVFETTLDKIFMEIKTFDELTQACHQKKPLQIMTLNGLVRTIEECKFLKMSSILHD